ncbi:GNAT family N-acetyltransferase [Deinococcus psychrotolerans]|uniref:GNAT family N-acetyltransferase n=1 Tax=Deinococcus psychrotolerans TaxID=2489213 RepID=A0A3G8YE71_9DEIO|nr:GNAT family N-acetyltransferase [Deinococcus psychrotolerans]AZI43140.1 GNAT family N-acetyltransferase [Deinococcus psychrotolerans]
MLSWTVRPAQLTELPLCAGILEAAARNLQARGESLWPHSAMTVERLTAQYPPASFRLGWLGGQAAATMVLLAADPDFWPDALVGEALYLHKLGVPPEFQGQGLAQLMLEAAVSEARAEGCTFLRLDTTWNRPKLRAIYEQFGFEVRGRKVVHGYDVALYELRV